MIAALTVTVSDLVPVAPLVSVAVIVIGYVPAVAVVATLMIRVAALNVISELVPVAL